MENFDDALAMYDKFLNQAKRLCKNNEIAEDITQNAYIKVYKNFGTFVQGTNLGAWINRIIFNEFAALYRYNKKRESITKPCPLELDISVVEHVVVDAFSQEFHEEISDCLSDGLKKLNKDQRDIILLVMEGFQYKEIAPMIGVSIGTVMSRLHRAREAMKVFALQLNS